LPAPENDSSGFILSPELAASSAGEQGLISLAKASALACDVTCCALVAENVPGSPDIAVFGKLPEQTLALIQDVIEFAEQHAAVDSAETDLVLRDQLEATHPLLATDFLAASILRSEQDDIIGLLALFDPNAMQFGHATRDKLVAMAETAQEMLLQRWYQDAYLQSPALLYATDDDGRIEEVSQLWLTHFGYKRDEVIGREPAEFMTQSAQQDLEGFANHIHLTAGVKDFPSQFVTAGGRAVDVLLSIALERQLNGLASKASKKSKCLLVDITLQIQIQRALEARARLDEMTGIPNRAWIRERFQVEVARAARYERPLSLVMFDADDFKQLNDKQGHAAGDHALTILANTARHQLRGPDQVGRIGGAELALVLPETDLAGAMQVAERLRETIAGMTMEESGLPCGMTISLGVVEVGVDANTDQAFARANAAMYEAKRSGRNRVVAWHAKLPAHPNAKADSSDANQKEAIGPLV